jgi:hypothetical protein
MTSRIETRGIPIVIVTGEETSDLDPEQFACILRKPMRALQPGELPFRDWPGEGSGVTTPPSSHTGTHAGTIRNAAFGSALAARRTALR